MEHTPEPWKCEKIDGTIYVYSPELSLSVCRMTDRTIEGQNQNARRIVACVNASRGLETDDIEGMVAKGKTFLETMATQLALIQTMDMKIDSLTADRDRWKELAVGLADLEKANSLVEKVVEAQK